MGTRFAYFALMNRKTLLAFVFFASTLLAETANVKEELSLAYTMAKTGRFTDAILKAQPLLDALKLDSVDTIVLGNKILAVSYCELGEEEKATETRDTARAFSPSEPFTEFAMSKKCYAFFGLDKASSHAVARKKSAKETPPLPKNAEVSFHADELPETRERTDTEGDRPIESLHLTLDSTRPSWKLYMPFGTGQFYNDQPEKAWAFLSTQALGTASAITMYTLFQLEKNSDGTFSDTDRAHLYKNSYWASIGVVSASAIWGILDAWLVHKKNSKKAINRRNPSLGRVDRSFGVNVGNYGGL